MDRRIDPRRAVRALLLLALPVFAACNNEAVNAPNPVGSALFSRYVALGNSITAGFQSGGINEQTQLQSYAVLLAKQMKTSFEVPLLTFPGCPVPLANAVTGAKLATIPLDCAFRKPPIPTRVNLVAVPGAAAMDPISNLDAASRANSLTTLLLGGRTQLEAAAELEPTFATVWIGENDWLGAALARNASLATPPAAFATRIDSILTALTAAGVEGGVLVGAAKITSTPHFSPGLLYFGLKQANQLPPTLTIAASCAPTANGGVGDQVFVPYSYGWGVLVKEAAAGNNRTLDCTDDSQVLTLAEIGALVAAAGQYNAAMEAALPAGWVFWDPNPLLDSLKQAGDMPVVPDLTAPTTTIFGKWFSLDGLHPNAAAHKLVANRLIALINEEFLADSDTKLAAIP